MAGENTSCSLLLRSLELCMELRLRSPLPLQALLHDIPQAIRLSISALSVLRSWSASGPLRLLKAGDMEQRGHT
jgi:hypothetical protein